MKLEDLKLEYDQLQKKYGAKDLDSIYYGGEKNNPEICFVFMNPTKKNPASKKEWQGLKAPWIGTKNIWDLFYQVNLLKEEVYWQIKSKKGSEWDYQFAELVYEEVKKHHYYITNLGKCTQVDARPLPDSTFKEYLNLFLKEIEIVNPKKIILFGNQVSSLVLNEKITVSTCRRKKFIKEIGSKKYPLYAVFYPVGNGRFNLDKAIDDIKWIIENE